MKKVLIAIPSMGSWYSRTGLCVVNMTTRTLVDSITKQGADIDLALHIQDNSVIPASRNNCVQKAQEYKVDYILFIDSDMVFPPEALQEMIAHDVDIVALNYTTRGSVIKPTAQNFDYMAVESRHAKTRLEEVMLAATGFMLIKMEVFEKLQKPYFNFAANNHNEIVGEDYFFCYSARAAGYKIFVDHELSLCVRHLGLRGYGHADIGYNAKKSLE
jgi:glycosyltransferase involved in cell wall biosynthesis